MELPTIKGKAIEDTSYWRTLHTVCRNKCKNYQPTGITWRNNREEYKKMQKTKRTIHEYVQTQEAGFQDSVLKDTRALI